MDHILQTYWSYIVTAITAVLFISQKGRKVIIILYNAVKKFISVLVYPFKIPAILYSMDDSIKFIKKELTYNGGNSLKDVVAKTFETTTLLKLRYRHDMSVSERAIFECEPLTGRCTWVNDALCELFGMSHEDMLGFGWLRAVREDQREEVHSHWKTAVDNNIPYSWSYYVVNQKTGDSLEVRATANAICLSNGTIIQYHGSIIPLKRRVI